MLRENRKCDLMENNCVYIFEMQKTAHKIIWAYFSTSKVHKILCYQFMVSHKEHDFQESHDLSGF